MHFAVFGDIHGSFHMVQSRLKYLVKKYPDLEFILQTGDTGFVSKPSLSYSNSLIECRDSIGASCLMPRVDNLKSAVDFAASDWFFDIPVYSVIGNHEDFFFVHEYTDGISFSKFTEAKKNFYLFGRFGQITLNSIRICYLSGIEPPGKEMLFVPPSERSLPDLKYYYAGDLRKFSDIVAPYPHVFLSHEGPYMNGYGSKVVSVLIKQLKPKFSFHGHLHTFLMGQLVSRDTYTVFLRPLLNSVPEESSIVLKLTNSNRLRIETWPDAGYLQV